MDDMVCLLLEPDSKPEDEEMAEKMLVMINNANRNVCNQILLSIFDHLLSWYRFFVFDYVLTLNLLIGL